MKIIKPAIILDEAKVRRNIEKMIEKTKRSKVDFRPHFKTHQSADIANWFKKYGVRKITVSSVDMAVYFSENGWDDITIAFVTNIRQIKQINKLANRIKLGLLIDSFEILELLAEKLESKVDIWIKIDTDYHRTGIDWNDISTIVKLIRRIKNSSKMEFAGLLTHSGHTYKTKRKKAIIQIYEDTYIKLKNIQEQLFLQGFTKIKLSIGDTPSCSLIDDFSGMDEIRPGNFVFYDVTQLNLQSCSEEEIAIAVACPIVAKYPKRNEIVIYGGAIHLSKEYLKGFYKKEKNFGLVALQEKEGWSTAIANCYIKSLSQEHGIVHATPELLKKVAIGDLLYILPIHSCLTANLLRSYTTLKGQILNFNDKI